MLFEQKNLVKSSHESETTTIFTLLLTLSPSAVRESYEWRWQRRDCWGIFQACGALITHLIWRLIGFATVHVINNNSLFGSRIPNHDFSIFWALGQQQCIEPKHENMLSMLYGEAVMDRKPPRKTHGQKLARFRQTLHYHHLSGLSTWYKNVAGQWSTAPAPKNMNQKNICIKKMKFKHRNNSKYKHLKMNDRSGSPKIHIHIWDIIPNFEQGYETIEKKRGREKMWGHLVFWRNTTDATDRTGQFWDRKTHDTKRDVFCVSCCMCTKTFRSIVLMWPLWWKVQTVEW